MNKKLIIAVMLFSSWGFCQTANTLSPEETKAGYDLLFNGSDLDNWHAYRATVVNDFWSVQTAGVLGPRIQNRSGSWVPIVSDGTYKNFDFKVEVALGPASNSGIFLRYQEIATNYGNQRSGPEFQICSAGDQDCNNQLVRMGACYAMFPVVAEHRETWDKTPGEWNEIRIVAYDSNYVHYGNGKKLLEYKIGTPEFITAYNRSKYANDGNNGNYYDIHFGGILLQNHNEVNPVSFRNLRIKELSTHPFQQEFAATGVWPDDLDNTYSFGKRGCTDANATNYDATAEVDDNSCTTPIISLYEKYKDLKILNYNLDNSNTKISISHPHKNFTINSVSGKRMEFKFDGNGGYLVKNEGQNLFVIRFQLDDSVISRLIHVQ